MGPWVCGSVSTCVDVVVGCRWVWTSTCSHSVRVSVTLGCTPGTRRPLVPSTRLPSSTVDRGDRRDQGSYWGERRGSRKEARVDRSCVAGRRVTGPEEPASVSGAFADRVGLNRRRRRGRGGREKGHGSRQDGQEGVDDPPASSAVCDGTGVPPLPRRTSSMVLPGEVGRADWNLSRKERVPESKG